MIPLVWQPDPDAHAYDIFHSGSNINLGKFKDAQVDQLLEQGRTTLDREQADRDLPGPPAPHGRPGLPDLPVRLGRDGSAARHGEGLRLHSRDAAGKPEPALLQAGVARPLTGAPGAAEGMAAYVGKRLLLLIPTLLGVSVLTFLLIHLIPGDLVTILLGITASQNEQTRQALIHALHLDRPLAVQYLLWLGEVLRGDLGHSLVTGLLGARRAGAELPGDAPARADGDVHRAGRRHPARGPRGHPGRARPRRLHAGLLAALHLGARVLHRDRGDHRGGALRAVAAHPRPRAVHREPGPEPR